MKTNKTRATNGIVNDSFWMSVFESIRLIEILKKWRRVTGMKNLYGHDFNADYVENVTNIFNPIMSLISFFFE